MGKLLRRDYGLPARRILAEPTVRNFAGRLHFHPCAECGYQFSCNCRTPQIDGNCSAHRQFGHQRAVWDQARDPGPCCKGNLDLVVDVAEVKRYRLAGPGPWFQCKTCCRAQGRLIAKECR